MANRIILGACLSLSLILTPSVALSVPTKDKKKSLSPSKVTKKTSSRKSKASSARTRREKEEEDTPVQASVVSGYEAAPRNYRHSVAETSPLMKVIPQRDGGFLLEPLTPKKAVNKPVSQSSKPDVGNERSSLSTPKYNRFEPWNFSDLILSQANSFQHTPYARGGSLATGSATDCSGFVQYIYHGFKIDLPRSSAEQAQVGKVVTQTMDFAKLLPGDLLFFQRGGHSVGHAGIYLGEGKMIHASNPRNGVTVTDLRQPYYEGTFVVAKRVFEVKYAD
jgi:cell wall-associated NlpC family hydrolase